MIEKLIEAAAVAAIAALGIPGSKVEGFWQELQPGDVKGHSDGSTVADIDVLARPRTFQSFSVPKADIALRVSLSVPIERDERGDAFQSAAAEISDLLQTWQLSIVAVKEAFAVDGFAPCGAHLSGGDVSIDSTARKWVIDWTVAIRGVVSQTTQTPQT